MGVMTSAIVYELAAPKYDENGKLIEDEFSDLPYVVQLWKRLWREMNYYKKVTISDQRRLTFRDCSGRNDPTNPLIREKQKTFLCFSFTVCPRAQQR